MPYPISYLICTTERTGSYLLCDALASTGIAGRPQEALHPASLERLGGQAGRIDYPLAFERIVEEGATPNGVFGAKVQWWQLQQLIQRLRKLPEFGGIGAVELLRHWLPEARYIRLTRGDKVRQAVSCLKATQTDIWWETDTWVRAGRPAPVAQPTFDFAELEGFVNQIGRHEAAWQLFFDAAGVQPLEITYEDLVRDHAASTRQVLDYLQIAAPADLVIGQPRYKKQADGVSEQWVRRYYELKTTPEAESPSTTRIQVPRAAREIVLSRDSAAKPPPIHARAERGRALRIVSYATEPLDGLPALLAHHISEHTPHVASCVWGGPPEETPAGFAAADTAAELLAAADAVLLHDGVAAPRHQAQLKNTAVVVLARHPHARQSAWLSLGAPGAVIDPTLAEQAAFDGWPRLSLPWESARDWERFWMPVIARALPPPEPHGRVVYRQALPAKQHPEQNQISKSMKITAYSLHDQVAALEPAVLARAPFQQPETAAGQPAASAADGVGWELRCPYAFEATWNGGRSPEDIAIRLDAPDAEAPPFVQSQLGCGRLSFYPGYQIQTEGPNNLWVRGPANAFKDGLAAVEQIVDTAVRPVTIAVTWQFTRPDQTVRFERGEPFAVLLPYPQDRPGQFELELIQPDEALEAYAQEFQRRHQAPAIQDALLLIQQDSEPATQHPAAAPARNWSTDPRAAPPVSCICPTYGRVALLEEAIESFLRQDYLGQKELIVLNDYPDQTLEFEHPEVLVVNVPRRFRSLGEKYQAAVALCSHDLIFVWNDDDISLPHRLSFSVTQLAQGREFFKANQAWFWNDGRLSEPQRNRFHGGACFTRALFVEAQGYPRVDDGYDGEFEAACDKLRPGVARGQPVAPEDLYYIYRWEGTGSYHLTTMGQSGQTGAAVTTYVQDQLEWGRIPSGRITLHPSWDADYLALVRDFLANGPAKEPDAPSPGRKPAAKRPNQPQVDYVDTVDGRVDLQQFEPTFFHPDRFYVRKVQDSLKQYSIWQPREFFVVDALKLAYLSVPKSACSSIKIALAKPAGIDYDLARGTEGIHAHGKWHVELDELNDAQLDYYRFSFVRNPFDRLVSCYRQKILFTPTPAMPHPLYGGYFFALPTNTSFADFAKRVCRIPDALADNHFKSQYALLYRAGELLVDYVGKLERVERDWAPLAERYQLAPLLIETNVSRDKPGTYRDYRRYYTEPLARLVYERYRQDIEAFGYQAEYEELLAFVGEDEPIAVVG